MTALPPVRLLSTAIKTPPHRLSQTAVRDLCRELFAGGAPGLFERLAPVYLNAGVETRYACAPLGWYRRPHGWTERAALFDRFALDLLEDAAWAALDAAKLRPERVDQVVCVTTTGVSTPSLEAKLAERLPLRADVRRTPLFGLGCAGAGRKGTGQGGLLQIHLRRAQAEPPQRLLEAGRLAGAGSLNRLQPAFHFGIGDPCRTLGGIAPHNAGRGRALRRATGLGHHDALAFGLDHDVLGPAMTKTLLDVPRTGPVQTKRFLAVGIAHQIYISFPEAVSPPLLSRRPRSFAASSTTRSLSPPAASAPCITLCRPKAKPNSSEVRQP